MIVSIAGMRYEVLRDETIADAGTVNHEKLEIVYRADLGFDQRNETILHEVMHALENAYGFQLPEQVVGQVARGVFAFMRDNPKFVKDLL